MQTLVKKFQEFNKTKSIELFTQIMNELYPNATKCKDCGNHILYYDTVFGGYTRKSKKTGKIEIYLAGKSFLTKKTHGETLCVCESCLKKKFPEYKQSRSFNNISNITAYAFDIQDRSLYFSGITKEKSIKKHGEEQGLKIWTEYCKRQAETNTFEYKSKKYGMTKKEFDDFNKSRAVTLENLIKKWGEETGTKKWNIYIERQKQTKSLEYMIKKFGIEKTQEINAKKCFKFKGYSESSQIFFNKIDKIISRYYTTYYASKNEEYGIQTSIGFKKLDYYIKELNICVEFNGDIWHANPKLYKNEECIHPFNKTLTCAEIQNYDKLRYEILKSEYNIDTLVIWEADLKTLNVNEFINNILNKK